MFDFPLPSHKLYPWHVVICRNPCPQNVWFANLSDKNKSKKNIKTCDVFVLIWVCLNWALLARPWVLATRAPLVLPGKVWLVAASTWRVLQSFLPSTDHIACILFFFANWWTRQYQQEAVDFFFKNTKKAVMMVLWAWEKDWVVRCQWLLESDCIVQHDLTLKVGRRGLTSLLLN